MKKILTLILVLCAGLGILIHQRIQVNYQTAAENELKKRAPIEIPDASIVTIQNVKDKRKPTIAFFYVDWCGYCKRFMPIYGEVAREYKNKFNFAVIHCEKPENLEMVKEFGVRGFPTLFIIDKKVNYNFPLSGSVTQDKDALKAELDKYLKLRRHFR